LSSISAQFYFYNTALNLKTLPPIVIQAQSYGYTTKHYWPRTLGSVIVQLYAGECTSSVDRP